jgi:hypothetical protein
MFNEKNLVLLPGFLWICTGFNTDTDFDWFRIHAKTELLTTYFPEIYGRIGSSGENWLQAGRIGSLL